MIIKRSLTVIAEALVISLMLLYLAEYLGLPFVRQAGGGAQRELATKQ